MSVHYIDILSSDEEDTQAGINKDDEIQETYVKLENNQVLLIEDSPDKSNALPLPELTIKKDNERPPSQRSILDVSKDSERQEPIPSDKPKTSEELAESRRKKIDILLNNFERAQFRLLSVEHMMDSAQKLRWSRLTSKTNNNKNEHSNTPMDYDNEPPAPPSSSTNRPNINGYSASPAAPTTQRPPWFIDPPGFSASCSRGGVGGSASSTYTSRRTTSTTTAATRVSTTRAPYKRRAYKKKRSSTTRRKATTSTAAKRAPKSSSYGSSSARASTTPSSSVKREAKVSKAVMVRVKREM